MTPDIIAKTSPNLICHIDHERRGNSRFLYIRSPSEDVNPMNTYPSDNYCIHGATVGPSSSNAANIGRGALAYKAGAGFVHRNAVIAVAKRRLDNPLMMGLDCLGGAVTHRSPALVIARYRLTLHLP
jgi:hypothetical protein